MDPDLATVCSTETAVSTAPRATGRRDMWRPIVSSIGAFLRAGTRPPTVLARAIVIVLAVKLIAVMAMMAYQHFADHSALVDATAISRLLGPSSAP
jgi:hypothetical protein